MSSQSGKALLVGDNPFHNISHLSQERTRLRDERLAYPKHAANLIRLSLENGANGFMFSVSETTLSILKEFYREGKDEYLGLYAIVPYAYEYVKLATQLGGIPGLATHIAKKIVTSGNIGAIAAGFKGITRTDPISLMKTYLTYEISRIKSSAGKHANIRSMLLHEVVTDMALALNLDWFFGAYITFMSKLKVTPGFNTCNFAYLINKLGEWNINLNKMIIAAPFNKVGFQMNPSRMECEKALERIPEPNVIGISIMAAGYLRPQEAAEYIATLPNIRGVAVGVSNEKHAQETFRLMKQKLR